MSYIEKPVYGIAAALVIVAGVGMTGCGTALNSSAPSSASTIQPQSQPAAGTNLGYIWDAAGQALRPVQGVPGASLVGKPILSAPSGGAAFLASASSGVSGTALFLDAKGAVFQSALTGGKLSQIASVPGATTLALSNNGSCAVVSGQLASGASVAAAITGLPQSPSIQILSTSAMPSIRASVASDTGSVALATGSADNAASAALVTAFAPSAGSHSAGTKIATLESFGGMQFVPGSDELVVADAATGALTAIAHVATAPVSAPLVAAGGIAAPVGLGITPNGRWLVAANHEGDVLRVDLTGAAAVAKSHCVCAPSQVLAMSGTTVRLVTESGPLWIVDAGAAAPRVLFIPAITTAPVPTITTRNGL